MDINNTVINTRNRYMLRQRFTSILCLLSLIVSIFVFWQLRFVGITMTDEACCGYIEHIHTEKCAESRKLICDIVGNEHTHSDSCYTIVYCCGLVEHTHTMECYTDPSADVEAKADWESTLPSLFNDKAVDIVSIAKSQLGYRESTKNAEFVNDNNGVIVKNGYTRYGAWYGDEQQFAYIDNWSAMFASFCLHYANIPEDDAPQNHGCNAMMNEWKECRKFIEADLYLPMFGDLVFFDKGNNGFANGVGIVSSVSESGFSAIEGNSNECVEENVYLFSDKSILGYGILRDPDDDTVKSRMLTFASSWFKQDAKKTESPILFKKSMFSLLALPPGTLNLTPYIADVDGDGLAVSGEGTVLQSDGYYSTSLKLEFSIPRTEAQNSVNAHKPFVYELPGDIRLSNSLINGGPYAANKMGESIKAFDYNFKVNPSIPEGSPGHYYIEVNYDSDYINSATESQIVNFIGFNCTISANAVTPGEGIKIQITDSCVLNIPPNKIQENFDISSNKTGSLVTSGGKKFRYTVNVISNSGTPNSISLSDTLTFNLPSGATVGNPHLISVNKFPGGSNVTSSCTFSPHADGHAFDMTLPKLGQNERYTITYEYDVNGLPDDATFSANNAVTAKSTSPLKDYTTSSNSNIHHNNTPPPITPSVTKSGTLQNGDIVWRININSAHANIAGELLTDSMFNQLNPSDISINPSNGYTIEYNHVTGKVTGIRFNGISGGTNTNSYTIQYTTPTNTPFGGMGTVHNSATFKGENANVNVGVQGGNVTKTIAGSENPDGATPGTITWNVGASIPSGGIAGGTEFKDIFGVENDPDSNAHYMTGAQYADLVATLQSKDWWSSMTGLAYTTDGTTFHTGTPGASDRVIGYRFIVASNAAGLSLAGKNLGWSYTTSASMETSGGGGDTYPEFVSGYSLAVGSIVQYNGYLYRAQHGGAGWTTDPSADYTLSEDDVSKPWYRIGPVGGAEAFRAFTNTFRVGDKEITVKKSFSSNVKKYNVTTAPGATYKPSDLSEDDLELYFNEDSTDKTFKWVVEVSATAGKQYHIADQLPEGVILRELYASPAATWEFTVYGSTVPFTSDGVTFAHHSSQTGFTIEGSYNAAGDNIVNLSVTPNKTGKIRIVYVCELDEAHQPGIGKSLVYELDNHVDVYEGDDLYGEGDNTIIVTTENRRDVSHKRGDLNYKKDADGHFILDSGGNKIWDNTITYTVDINNEAENLLINPELDPNDTLHITDILEYVYKDSIGSAEAILNLDSIRLEDANTHELIAVEWTVHSGIEGNKKYSTIEGDVPDGRHLIFTYTYTLWSTMQSGITLNNNFTLEGDGLKNQEIEDSFGKEEFTTQAGSDLMKYRLYKVDKESRKPLVGAKFTTYKWAYDNATHSYKWIPIGKEYVSDALGIIQISPTERNADDTDFLYSRGVAYCIMETEPPIGYVLDESQRPTYYFWISSNNATKPEHAPDDFSEKALDLANSNGQEYVENQRDAVVLLPETGYIGTLPYTVCGMLLMVLSLALIIYRKKQIHKRSIST